MNIKYNKYAHLAPPPPAMPSLVSQHKDKRKHASPEAAQRAAAKMAAKERTKFISYQCPVCGWYHIGHAWKA